MKLFLGSLVFAASLISLSAHAGGTICAGQDIHYSTSYTDTGVEPPTGTPMGVTFLSRQGKLLGRKDFNAGELPTGSLNYKVELLETPLFSATIGNDAAGSRYYSGKLTLKKIGGNEQLTEDVTCRDFWAHVP